MEERDLWERPALRQGAMKPTPQNLRTESVSPRTHFPQEQHLVLAQAAEWKEGGTQAYCLHPPPTEKDADDPKGVENSKSCSSGALDWVGSRKCSSSLLGWK